VFIVANVVVMYGVAAGMPLLYVASTFGLISFDVPIPTGTRRSTLFLSILIPSLRCAIVFEKPPRPPQAPVFQPTMTDCDNAP